MIRVLDLFAGTQSVKKALTEKYKIINWDLIHFDKEDETIGYVWSGWNGNEYVVEYIGVDIYSPEDRNLILNLAQENIIESIKWAFNGWKPDFIWASPICNKFSVASTGPNGNTYFIVDKEQQTIRPRLPIEYHEVKHNGFNKKPENWEKYKEEAVLAMILHENTRDIINYFNVPFAIENPYTSLARYIYKDFKRNKADYCAYGFEYKKSTAIYSSIELQLKTHSKEETHRHLRFDRINKTTNWPSHWNKDDSTYANRSSVPPKLISEIFSQLIEEELLSMIPDGGKGNWDA